MRRISLVEPKKVGLHDPVKQGGALFRAHRLTAGDDKIVVVPTLANLLFSTAAFLLPCILVVGGTSTLDKEPLGGATILVLGGGGLCLGLAPLLRAWRTKFVFDKKSGRLAKTGVFGGVQGSISFLEFSELQILEELCVAGSEGRRHFHSRSSAAFPSPFTRSGEPARGRAGVPE